MKIETTQFRFAEYRRWLDGERESIAAFKARQETAFLAERERWAALPAPDESLAAPPPEQEEELPAGTVAVRSDVTGSVWQIQVKPGDRVSAGDRLVILETMKMETPILAPSSGEVVAVKLTRGALVTAGQIVIALRPTS